MAVRQPAIRWVRSWILRNSRRSLRSRSWGVSRALDSKIDRKGPAAPLVPDPKVVRSLLTRYASLQIAHAESEKLERARELEDVSYTLCVMTGTRCVHDAIAAADALLVAAQSAVPTPTHNA
ncbi:DUF5133 domain-containing protein [Streptomyces sp. NPDC004589]|uniref:DUF5133 domain-containing protein n=1 Tax=Streptomyces sp. NPDC004589 TaxID=3154553 RepID=UPI0033BD22C2